MIRDIVTWWNSTAELVQRGLELSSTLKILCVKAEYNKFGCGGRLARFQLSPEEWRVFENLSPLLDVSCCFYSLSISITFVIIKVFLFATNQISTNKIPLVKSFQYLMSLQWHLKITLKRTPFPLLSIMQL